MQIVIGKISLLASGLPRSWMLIGYILPMALACAGIAGLPVSMALISIISALLCCYLLGKQSEALMVITPFSTLVLSTAIACYDGASAEHSAIASLMTLFTGIWLLLLTFVLPRGRMNWIARPVWHGICLGITIILVVLIVPMLLGVIPENNTWTSFWKVVTHWQNWHWPSVVLSLISILLFLLWHPSHQPKALWLIVLMWILGNIWSFDVIGVMLPVRPKWQFMLLTNVVDPDWLSFIFMSASIALLIYIEICQHLTYQVHHNFEMAGVINVLSGIVGGIVVGLCRISGRVYKVEHQLLPMTLLLLLLTLCWWWSAYIPLPALGVIALYVLYRQFRWCELRLYWRQWSDLCLLALTALFIISVGILSGIWLIMTLSMIFMWWRLVRKRAWPLLQPELQIITDTIVITLPQPLLFANARSLLHYVGDLAKDLPHQKVYMDVHCGCCLDVTVLIYLQSLARRMYWHQKKLYLCGLTEQALKVLQEKHLDYLPAEQLRTTPVLQLLSDAIQRENKS